MPPMVSFWQMYTYEDCSEIARSFRAGTVLNPSKLGGLYTTKLESKFYIVIGAFRERVNAETLVKKVSAQGYPATLISFRNGYNVVGICPSNTPQAIYDTLKEVREKDFCPDDVWVLMNE